MNEPPAGTGNGRVADAAWALGLLCLVLAIADAIAGLFAGIGYRLDLWDYRDGIGALRYVFWVAAVTTALAALATILGASTKRTGAIVTGLIALLIAATTAYIPWSLRQTARRVPPIHDISTDTVNPPEFQHIARLRRTTDHPVAYAGPEVAALQKKGYPDIQPILLRAPADRVFDAAKGVLLGMGMRLIDADPAGRRLEATDTSILFGFEDDMVVRITEAPQGTTRVDVRSTSRVGQSDLGINAGRIRLFAATLRRKLNA